MTDAYFVITAIGDDQPGLVEALSATIRAQGGNWLESSMSHLAGKFAGIVRVSVPAAKAEALQAALQALPQLRVVAEAGEDSRATARRLFSLSLVGHDRAGIVQEVAQVLARFGVNVEELVTHTSSAPMSGDLLFHAEAKLSAPESADIPALQAALEGLSNELCVEMAVTQG